MGRWRLLRKTMHGWAWNRSRKVDVWWWLRRFDLGVNEPGLQVNDVLSQRIVLSLEHLELLLHLTIVAHLLLELLDVAFLSLTESPL